MTQLAKEFALSDVALHKICKKHGIPNPPPGWWAKKAAGKRALRAPLPSREGAENIRITIADPDLSRQGAALAAVHQRARSLAAAGDDGCPTPSHPIVERTIAHLRKLVSSERGLVASDRSDLIKCEIAPQSIDRLAVFLPEVIKACNLQGFRLVPGERSAQFQSDSECVSFVITETVRQEKHVITDAERAEYQSWERKHERALTRNSWRPSIFIMPRFADWDYHPTGQLSFELEHIYGFRDVAPRRSFRDAKIQRLENMASEIAVGLSVVAAAKTEERLQREAQQRLFEEQRRMREQAARARYIEERREAGLVAILGELEKLEHLRRLVEMLQTRAITEQTPRLSAFLAWTQEYLANREAILSEIELEARFESERLFGDTDDHGFPMYGR